MLFLNRGRFIRAGIVVGLVAVGIFAADCVCAEDIVATRQQNYRGTVREVTADGIRFEIPGTGVITIPRAAVTQMRVEPPPSITRGIAAYEHGNIREARQSLDRVVFQYQGLDVDWAMKGLLYFGQACLQGGDLSSATKSFEAFIKAYPESDLLTDAHLGMAEVELLNKNYEKALTDLRELVAPFDAQLKPPADQITLAAAAYLGIGRALEAQQQLPEAADAYLRVIALYPDQKAYPEALYRAGSVLNSLGKFKKAEQLLNDLNDNYPDNSFAKEAEPIRQSVAAKAREAEAVGTSGTTQP